MPGEPFIHDIPLNQIVPRPQVRRQFDETELAELAATIRHVGVQQPIHVRRVGDRFVIVFGERRWLASKLAGKTTIPVIVIDGPMSDAEILQAQIVENVQRADLSPLALAEGIHALMEAKGCTAAEAAQRIGKSPATVSKSLSLLTLPDHLKAKVASGEIGLRAGHALARAGAAHKGVTPTPERKQKLTALLDAERSVSVTGVDGTMDAFVGAIETLLARIKAARKQSVELCTFLAMLRDQATANRKPTRS